ncbi:MAG TPA: hypothetical protein VMW29_03540 [Candidatus Bathyarchaeia archaeon]|nr:hypothetical protein [Candidatus Bathyarchaeia archaeon]
MNKKFLIFLFIFLFIGLFTHRALAGRELEDYLYQYEKYSEVYKNFSTSRDKFLKYKVLNIRQEATQVLSQFLLQRNQVLRTYFLLLKYRLRTDPGVITLQAKDELVSQLDKRIIWLEEQDEEIKKLVTPDFEDLFVISDRIEDKNEELLQLGYKSLSEMILAKIRSLQQESVAAASLLQDEISSKKTATQAAQLDLWLKEINVKNYLAQKEIEAAEINLWNLNSTSDESSMVTYFTNLKIDAEDAKIFLMQANSYQKEIYEQVSK